MEQTKKNPDCVTIEALPLLMLVECDCLLVKLFDDLLLLNTISAPLPSPQYAP